MSIPLATDKIFLEKTSLLTDLHKCYVLIPAFNESKSIINVIRDIPKHLVAEIIVIDNGSTDNTGILAEAAGAIVLKEPRKGYGYACLKGIEYLKALATGDDIIIFLDGDYSDFPGEMELLIKPIAHNNYDLVIGARLSQHRHPGSMLPQQVFGNWLATRLINLFYSIQFSDLGPFRAIRWSALNKINMQDKTFGWTVEMQVKAAKLNLCCTEVPVSYRKRIGVSKVSGTVRGTILAGYKILLTIFKNL